MGKLKNRKTNIPFTLSKASPLQPRLPEGQPLDFRSQYFVYRLKNIDYKGRWGWSRLKPNDKWHEVVKKLDDYQTQKWGGVLLASGGKSSGTNNHVLSTANLNDCAQKRLIEIERDDVTDIYSIRLSATERVYGTREQNFFDMLWFDDDHGENNNCVCRTNRTKN
jgi:hypothetical protein